MNFQLFEILTVRWHGGLEENKIYTINNLFSCFYFANLFFGYQLQHVFLKTLKMRPQKRKEILIAYRILKNQKNVSYIIEKNNFF
jgi:hypothetical protein